MSAPDLPPGVRERLTRIFAAYPELREVVLYGSRATGASTPRSDIDLATRGLTDHRRLGHLASDLEESDILQKCDVRAYESIESAALRDHIERDGVAIYRADGHARMLSAMKAIDAAYEVLREAGEPLRARELSDRMLASGLWATKGKTPWSTVAVAIQVDIKENGERSRFLQVAGGPFALNPAYAGAVGGLSKDPLSVVAGPVAPATRTAGPMSFLDAAQDILQREGRALHYEEIMRRAIAQNLVQTKGQTPAYSLSGQISNDIRRHKVRGEPQRFARTEKGYIGLAEPLPSDLESQIKEHNAKVRADLVERAKEGASGEFEELIGKLLKRMGFKDVTTNPSKNKDGGIDVLGTLVVDDMVHIQVAVQAKRYNDRNVHAPVVDAMLGSMMQRKIGHGLIITTSDFSTGAREKASDSPYPIELVNGEDLAGMLVEHRLGAERGETLFRLLDPESDDAD